MFFSSCTRDCSAYLKNATAAKTRTAMIAAVQINSQTFLGIFVFLFIVVVGKRRTVSRSENRPELEQNQYTISSQGRPYSLSFCMNGAGSNSSMLKTPGPFHVPVASIIAPIMAGTPVV